MKIWRLEIRWDRTNRTDRTHGMGKKDLRFALAVPDTMPIYRAFLQIIEEAEREALAGAREQVANERLCVNSLGMADGAALVRRKLEEARADGLRTRGMGEGPTGTE